MSQHLAGYVSTGRFTSPTSRAARFSDRVLSGFRTSLFAPLRQKGEFIGTLGASHRGAPLHTGADQAPGNVRRPSGHRHRERPAISRFKESLEQQTATSEILGVIASSPTDIQPVLDVIVENVARLCDAETLRSAGSMVNASSRLRIADRFHSGRPTARARSLPRDGPF